MWLRRRVRLAVAQYGLEKCEVAAGPFKASSSQISLCFAWSTESHEQATVDSVSKVISPSSKSDG